LQPYWERIAGQRISRRRALGYGAAASFGVAALTIVGCSDSGGNGSGTPAARETATAPDQPDVLNPLYPPQRGGRLVSANAANFGTWDPHLGIAVASAYFPRVYNMLLNQSATRPEFVVMDLAESYEVPDEQTYIFTVRPGVRVGPNDLGVPERALEPEDVRQSMERIRTLPQAQNYAFASQHIDTVNVDGNRVIMRTPGPYAWFLNRIGYFLSAIVPRELLEGDTGRLSDKAAGGGPYRLVSVTEGDLMRLDANANYYARDAMSGEQLPYLSGLEVRVVYDRSSLRTAFQSGQVHQFMTGDGNEARSMEHAVVSRDPGFTYVAFTMNPVKKPFDDPRVRRAVSRAINRQQFIDLVYGGDAQADGIVQWSLGSYVLPDDELSSTYQPYDLDEAKRLVDEVGGISFKMLYPAETSILEHSQHLPIFVRQMEEAGIKVEHDPVDFGTWIARYHDIDYDSSLALNQQYETPELPLAFHTERGPFGDGTFIRGLGDPEIEAAVRKASATLDYAARIQAVHDAQKRSYARDPMMLPLVTPYNHLVWSDKVHNIPAGIGTSSFMVNTSWMET
jgi:peptide/nickel transport system substrate-binding protein